MTTGPHPTSPEPHTDPMSDTAPMGASDAATPRPGAAAVRPVDLDVLARDAGVTADALYRERVRVTSVAAADRVIKQVRAPGVDVAEALSDSVAAGAKAASDVSADYVLWGNTPVEDRAAMLQGSLWPAPAKLSEEAEPFTRAAAEGMIRRLARPVPLADVDPWRVPADGLLEYDPVHDEWRVEVWRDPLGAQIDRGRIVVRRYAGRRTDAALSAPARGRFISMNQYLVGGDDPGAPRVSFRPSGDDPGRAAYLARWRRVAEAYRKARRPAYDRGRHLHNWPTKPDRDDQVDAMAYSLNTLARLAAPAGTALAELQGASRRLAAGLGMALERSGGRRGRGA